MKIIILFLIFFIVEHIIGHIILKVDGLDMAIGVFSGITGFVFIIFISLGANILIFNCFR